MGLSESGLKSDIEDIFESNDGDGPDSMEAFAADLAEAIVTYLSDVEIDPSPEGTMASSPFTVDSDATGYDGETDGVPSSPTTPSDGQSALEATILASCQASESANERIWSAADAGYSALLMFLTTWSDNSYTGIGTVVPGGTVDFAAAWEVGEASEDGEVGGTKSDIAEDLADRIHTVTTDSTFAGAGTKGSFISVWESNLK